MPSHPRDDVISDAAANNVGMDRTPFLFTEPPVNPVLSVSSTINNDIPELMPPAHLTAVNCSLSCVMRASASLADSAAASLALCAEAAACRSTACQERREVQKKAKTRKRGKMGKRDEVEDRGLGEEGGIWLLASVGNCEGKPAFQHGPIPH